ncbi:MAG TPA: hypothetical protein VFB06_01290 [Streptosporangiaceae bacterium]|nr:hypothetical protein [Streptosporangiaceae bacterium]
MTTAPSPARPVAQLVSDWLEPRTWVTGTGLLIGWHADRLAGAGWAMLAVLAGTVLPAMVISHGVRRGRYADRHITNRSQRLPVLLFVLACVAACLGLLALAGAPRAVIALTITMAAAITVLTAVTAAWKISIHCAVCSGGATVLVITFGPALAPVYLLVAFASWSRVALREHTTAQAIAGAAAGAASALIYLALR